MLIKFLAYFITDSNAILTDASESIVNVLASAFAFYSIYISALPKDTNHPYGHGKIEFFSAFIEGLLISLAGFFIITKAIYNIFFPKELHLLLTGTILILFTGVINGLLAWWLIVKGKSLQSITLKADGKHLLSDAISSFGLVLGLLIIYFTKVIWMDILISILLGLYIIYTGYQLIRKSVGGLMDETDIEIVNEVILHLNQNRKSQWIDIHNLRTQRYGAQTHIDCHVTLPYYFDLNRVHDEVTQIDQVVNKNLSLETEFFIHADPCLPICCHYCGYEPCDVRRQPQTVQIMWDLNNLTQNKKHFER
jgi:cation diffusion facilitator family transporter